GSACTGTRPHLDRLGTPPGPRGTHRDRRRGADRGGRGSLLASVIGVCVVSGAGSLCHLWHWTAPVRAGSGGARRDRLRIPARLVRSRGGAETTTCKLRARLVHGFPRAWCQKP